MRNFCCVMAGGIDYAALLTQLTEQPDLWKPDPYWLQHKQGSVLYAQDNIVLRYIKAPGYTRPAMLALPAAQDIVRSLLWVTRGALLGNVVISRLGPRQEIVPHIDTMPPGIPPLYQRHQVPLSVAPGCLFHCGDESVYMRPGQAWWFNNQVTHSVKNDSDADRISMFVDIAPLLPAKDTTCR